MYIVLKTQKRTTVYSHDLFMLRFSGVIEVVRVVDRKVVDVIKPYDTKISENIEITGEDI